MIPSAVPLLSALQARMDRLALAAVAFWHLHGPGRWVLALAVLAAAWLAGRLGGGLIGSVGRVVLLVGAVWFGYSLLRVGV